MDFRNSGKLVRKDDIVRRGSGAGVDSRESESVKLLMSKKESVGQKSYERGQGVP